MDDFELLLQVQTGDINFVDQLADLAQDFDRKSITPERVDESDESPASEASEKGWKASSLDVTSYAKGKDAVRFVHAKCNMIGPLHQDQLFRYTNATCKDYEYKFTKTHVEIYRNLNDRLVYWSHQGYFESVNYRKYRQGDHTLELESRRPIKQQRGTIYEPDQSDLPLFTPAQMEERWNTEHAAYQASNNRPEPHVLQKLIPIWDLLLARKPAPTTFAVFGLPSMQDQRFEEFSFRNNVFAFRLVQSIIQAHFNAYTNPSKADLLVPLDVGQLGKADRELVLEKFRSEEFQNPHEDALKKNQVPEDLIPTVAHKQRKFRPTNYNLMIASIASMLYAMKRSDDRLNVIFIMIKPDQPLRQLLATALLDGFADGNPNRLPLTMICAPWEIDNLPYDKDMYDGDRTDDKVRDLLAGHYQAYPLTPFTDGPWDSSIYPHTSLHIRNDVVEDCPPISQPLNCPFDVEG